VKIFETEQGFSLVGAEHGEDFPRWQERQAQHQSLTSLASPRQTNLDDINRLGALVPG
jgi:hypothetical protein